MFKSVPPSVKRIIRPVALPAWLKLQESEIWHHLLSSTERWRPPRELQAFGVGLPKTGTVSLANLLSANYRASHEPETWILTHVLKSAMLSSDRKMTLHERIAVLKARDQVLNLMFESNFVLGLLIDTLYAAFPTARYILTVRNCYTWIDSEINQQYVTGHRQPWSFLADYRYGAQRNYQKEDICLEQYNLYPVSEYFSYWAGHIKKVIATIPATQLLVVRTEDLSRRTGEIADFLGVSHYSMSVEQAHSHERRHKPLNIFDLVGEGYLESQASFYCKDIMNEFYGGVVVNLPRDY